MKYVYQLSISCANRDFKIKKIWEEIEYNIKEYSVRSISARNPKKILEYNFNEARNLITVTYCSDNEIKKPLIGLKLLSTSVYKDIEKSEEKSKYMTDIVRNNCVFRLVETPKAYKLEDEQIENYEKYKMDVSIEETRNIYATSTLLQNLVGLLLNPEPSIEEREKIKAIKKILES